MLLLVKVKGGDNNCVPRSNYWSDDIPIEELFSHLDSGGVQITSKTEKALFINNLVSEFGKKLDSQCLKVALDKREGSCLQILWNDQND